MVSPPFFRSKAGCLSGDPLSPYLFIITTLEFLAIYIRNNENENENE